MQAHLDVVGEVQALVADQSIGITAIGNRITVDLPTLKSVMVALRGTGRRKRRARTLARLDAALRFSDLSVQFQLAGGTVALLGAAAKPGALSRLLGLMPLEIRVFGLLALLRPSWR